MRWLALVLVGCAPAATAPDAPMPNLVYHHTVKLKAPVIHDHAWFGARVALAGDGRSLAIGVPRDQSGQTGVASDGMDRSAPDAGAVYIFDAGTTGWIAQAFLKPAVAGEGDQFGSSIGLSTFGDTLVVGAPGEASGATTVDGDANDNSASGAGAAYVFKRHGNQWVQQGYLKASNATGGDEFGVAVAVAGDGATVAVGAPLANGTSGAAYTFATDGESWAPQAILPGSPLERFGTALAFDADGSTLAVGALDAVSVVQRGVVQARLAGLAAGDAFGASVALSGLGTTLVVGAPLAEGHGTATTYALDGVDWTEHAALATPFTQADDGLGRAVAISRDAAVAVATVPGDDLIEMNGGSALVFANDNTTRIDAGALIPYYGFGTSAALSSDGGVLAIGAILDPIGGDESGAVYLFY